MLSTALKLKNSRNCKNYSLTPTICWKFSKAFGTHPDSFISGDVCCYSQPRFDGAAKLFHKLGKGCSPDHGSFPVAGYECQWPRVSCVKASGGFPGQWSLHWQTWDRRRALISGVHLGHLALVPSFLAVSPLYSASQWPQISPQPRSYLLVLPVADKGCDGFKPNVNSTLHSLKNLGDAILVRETRAQ